MNQGQFEDDYHICSALGWLANASGNPVTFFDRLEHAQEAYRNFTGADVNRGQDPQLSDFSQDINAAFFAQAKSLIEDRRSYDLALASKIVPWVRQLGSNVKLLNRIKGARERAARMLSTSTVLPDSALFELIIASNYAANGCEVEFIEESKGRNRTPDLKLTWRDLSTSLVVECKRLGRGQYEKDEQERHRHLFRSIAALIDVRRLSVHIDVSYTRELAVVPETYLLEHLQRHQSRRTTTRNVYSWSDEYGRGEIKDACVAAVRADIHNGSLYFGTKLARLLSGRVVRESGYHLAAGGTPDRRDPRYIEELHYGSVVTWQCIASAAIERKSRYVKAKLVEADRQLQEHGIAIAHLAMDTELQCESSDMRRARNIEAIKSFVPAADLMAIHVHYIVPRISESHSWLVDETVDTFTPLNEPMEPVAIFTSSEKLKNDLPAWKQPLSPY